MDIYKTREFSRLAATARLTDAELLASAKRAERGLADAEIGKFLIKQRVPRRGKGRSGGFRAILFHRQGDKAVFLHLRQERTRHSIHHGGRYVPGHREGDSETLSVYNRATHRKANVDQSRA